MKRAAPLFHETQSFRLLRMRLMVAIPPAGMTLLLIWQVLLGHPWGDHPMSNGNVIGWTIFLWLVYLRLMTVRLVTDVDGQSVRVAMRGLWRRRLIPLQEIKAADRVTYDAMRDWGGYGIRSNKRGTAFTAGGSSGVLLHLASGGVVLIGSARVDELLAAIRAGSQC